MIFGLIKKLTFGIIKKILTLIVIVVLAIWFVFFRDDGSSLIHQARDFFSGNDIQININEKDEEVELSQEHKEAIDRWLEINDYNQYGDPKGTFYAGGTPLFDESTGESIDRYKYLINKYPELKNLPH